VGKAPKIAALRGLGGVAGMQPGGNLPKLLGGFEAKICKKSI